MKINYTFSIHKLVVCKVKKREEPSVRTNGSVDYSDIKGFRYFGITLERRKYIVPPRVVIIGDDFEVEIYASKSLIKELTT